MIHSQRGSSQYLVWGQQGCPPQIQLMLPSAVADILAEMRVTLGERPQGLSGDKPGRMAVLAQPLRLVRLTFQSQRKRQSLHFIPVCAGGGPSIQSSKKWRPELVLVKFHRFCLLLFP